MAGHVDLMFGAAGLAEAKTGKVLARPALREHFSTGEITPSTPEAFAGLIRGEIPKWRRVFESAKIAPE
jgi:hypothetical protein